MNKKAKKYINGAVDKLVAIIQSNGTPRPENANVPDENLPWMFARLPPLEIANCMLWKGIIFDIFCVNFLHKEDRFIPQGCQNCHKVVVKPRTYKELLDLRKLQVELDYPSKCGIEERSFSKGLYGGYFYCGGIEDGRSRFRR